jgi:DNA-binding NarL/FixJ family response regulator
VRAAGRGQLFLDPSAAAALSSGGSAGEDLTPREREVLLLVARGMSNRQIAAALTVGEETVKSHVAGVLGKLGLSQRGQVAVWALKRGWVGLDELAE